MSGKKWIALLMAAAMVLSLAACSESAPVPAETVATVTQTEAAVSEEQEVTDMVGRQVTIIPGSYSRVVCIGAGALRMYSYIGSTGLLAGVEDIDNPSLADRPKMFDAVARPYLIANQEAFSTLPSCGVGGPMAQTAEAEKILSCDPDIVISEYEDADKANALQQQLGVPVITLSTGSQGVFDPAFAASMRLLGTVFSEEEKAEALVAFVQTQTDEIRSHTAGIAQEDKPSVYICGLGNWGTTDHLMTSQKYISFEIANVKNAVSGLSTDGVTPIEEELFVSLGSQMDIMIMDAAAVKNIAPMYQQDPGMFDACKAWQDGEVYLQMAYNAYYTNFEIALINTWFVAKTVYPELFQDIDMTEKTNEITKAFLGAELAEPVFACPSSFGGYQKIDTASFFA